MSGAPTGGTATASAPKREFTVRPRSASSIQVAPDFVESVPELVAHRSDSADDSNGDSDAMSAYSIAVAPDSFATNFLRDLIIVPRPDF
jgi:hypothetical protein